LTSDSKTLIFEKLSVYFGLFPFEVRLNGRDYDNHVRLLYHYESEDIFEPLEKAFLGIFSHVVDQTGVPIFDDPVAQKAYKGPFLLAKSIRKQCNITNDTLLLKVIDFMVESFTFEDPFMLE